MFLDIENWQRQKYTFTNECSLLTYNILSFLNYYYFYLFLITGVTEGVPVFKGEQELQLGLTCVLERGKTTGRQLLCGF